MTIQMDRFNWQKSGLNWNAPPYESCAPNSIVLRRYLIDVLGGVDLGCEADRNIRAGATISEHAFGVAFDWRYAGPGPGEAVAKRVLKWLIQFSKELGVQGIHDYVGDVIWYAGRTSSVTDAFTAWWKKQYGSGGQMGESWAQWFHITTTRGSFYDTRPIQNRGIPLLNPDGTYGVSAPPPVVVPPPAPKPPVTTGIVLSKIPHGANQAGAVRVDEHDVKKAQGVVSTLSLHPDEYLTNDAQWGLISIGACMDFQRFMDLEPDGIVGPKTWSALVGSIDVGKHLVLDRVRPRSSNAEWIKLEVKRVQGLLNGLMLRPGTFLLGDGDYGPATEAKVKQFQAFVGLEDDGICGPNTWRALLGAGQN